MFRFCTCECTLPMLTWKQCQRYWKISIYNSVQDDVIKCQETYTTNALVFLSVGKTDNKLWDLTRQRLSTRKNPIRIIYLMPGRY